MTLNAQKSATISVTCSCKGKQPNCSRCDGAGEIIRKACRRCGGTGKETTRACVDCRGDGWRELDQASLTDRDDF